MAEVKQPLFSLRAQGKVGPIYFSTHGGGTYAYGAVKQYPRTPTPAQEAQRADFKAGVDIWPQLDAPTKAIYTWIAQHQKTRYKKDCKPSRWAPVAYFMHDWLTDVPDEVKLFGLLAIIAFLALKYAWVAALLFP